MICVLVGLGAWLLLSAVVGVVLGRMIKENTHV